jgi:type III pantothenate kinase
MKSKTEILHLVDIGNTRATYSRAVNGRLSPVKSLIWSEIPEKIRSQSKKGAQYKNIVIISSVVPQNMQKITSELYARGPYSVLEVGKDLLIPLKHKYKNINKLGVDRKINAYGAVVSHKTPCLVFDYGTALTCDLIDARGCFLGGLIIPGPETSLKCLLDRAAMLPKVFNLRKESGLPYGRSTKDCIQHGVIQAYAAMTDGLISRLSKELKSKPHVVITGGFSSFIGKIIRSRAEINPAHTLQSILRLYLNSKKR